MSISGLGSFFVVTWMGFEVVFEVLSFILTSLEFL